MTPPETVADAAALAARAFEERGISYAIGGALAYGLYGAPRATLDADLNVFVEPDRLAPVFEALRSLGISVDAESAERDARSEGMFMVHFGPFRLDLFVPSIPFSWEAEAMRVRRPAPPHLQEAWFLSAEALCVFKLLFFRSKDVADLERLIARQGKRLDASLVRRHIVEMMGEDDPRVATWDELVREFANAGT